MKNKKKNLKQMIALGSKTAKGGFSNEQDVIDRFNDWKKDKIAQEWLIEMNYKIDEIEFVRASKVRGQYKADIQVRITIIMKFGLGHTSSFYSSVQATSKSSV